MNAWHQDFSASVPHAWQVCTTACTCGALHIKSQCLAEAKAPQNYASHSCTIVVTAIYLSNTYWGPWSLKLPISSRIPAATQL